MGRANVVVLQHDKDSNLQYKVQHYFTSPRRFQIRHSEVALDEVVAARAVVGQTRFE